MKHPKLLSLLGLTLFIALSFHALSSDDAPIAAKAHEQQADYFAGRIVSKQFNHDGKPQSVMISQSMTHFPNNTALLKQVTLILYQQNEAPVKITADKARILDNHHRIVLQDHVTLTQARSKTNSEKTVLTDEISYYPKQKIARTDKAVVYREPSTEVHSVGMSFDLQAKTIHLSSHARGRYASTDSASHLQPIAITPVRLAERSAAKR